MSSAFRLDQIYILCTVDCRLKIGFSHIYVSYTIFFFSLIWSSSGIKLSYLACNFYPSDSNDQHCWRVLLHVISSVLSTSTVYQNQLARLWKKNTKMSNFRITPRHIEKSLGCKSLGTKNPRLTSDRVCIMSGSRRVFGLPPVQQNKADGQSNFVGYICSSSSNLDHPRGKIKPREVKVLNKSVR